MAELLIVISLYRSPRRFFPTELLLGRKKEKVSCQVTWTPWNVKEAHRNSFSDHTLKPKGSSASHQRCPSRYPRPWTWEREERPTSRVFRADRTRQDQQTAVKGIFRVSQGYLSQSRHPCSTRSQRNQEAVHHRDRHLGDLTGIEPFQNRPRATANTKWISFRTTVIWYQRHFKPNLRLDWHRSFIFSIKTWCWLVNPSGGFGWFGKTR